MPNSTYLPVVFPLQEDGFQWLHELAKISPLCMDLKLWDSHRYQIIIFLIVCKMYIWQMELGSLNYDLQYPTRMSRYLDPHWSCFCKSNSCVNVASVTQLSSPSPEYCLQNNLYCITKIDFSNIKLKSKTANILFEAH